MFAKLNYNSLLRSQEERPGRLVLLNLEAVRLRLPNILGNEVRVTININV